MADDQLERFSRRRARIREDMGGPAALARLRAAGRATIRQRIDALADAGSFEEIGTFAVSEEPGDRGSTPGDGKIGGHALIDGRPVTVAGDDVTVKRGSSAVVGDRRVRRLYEQALQAGTPFVYLGETGGARIPDSLGSEGFTKLPPPIAVARRARRIPLATVIVGESFGGSSFLSALSDLVVQVRGSCLAVTSPRVIEMATGEQISMEELGGADVHGRLTGQIDLLAADEAQAFGYVRSFLSYLPPNSWTRSPTGPQDNAQIGRDPALAGLVPADRRESYDIKTVIRRLADDGGFLELKPSFGASLVTGLARLGGSSVGIIASQPSRQAGVLTAEACDKATRLICLCDAFDIPLIFLQDCPGFIVGKRAEHGRLLHKAMMFFQALALARTPKLTVVLRKAFGLAYYSLCGNDTAADYLYCWPSAEIGFMDPYVGANVLHAEALQSLDPAERAVELNRLAADMESTTEPYGAAGTMRIDEVIDPADTRALLAAALRRLSTRERVPPAARPLTTWPTCW